MKFALAQINSTVGDFERNYAKITSCVKKAQEKKAAVVVFPELALCGYPPEDLLFKPSFIEKNTYWLKKVQEQVGALTCIVGFVHREGEALYNAAAVLHNHKLVDIYHKIELPNYGVFDEKRYFFPGAHYVLYTIQQKTIAVSICEDIWTDTLLSGLRDKKIDVLVNLSSSPFYLGKLKQRIEVLSRKAQLLQCTLFYCNAVGGQDELVFDGNSMVFNSRGEVVAKAESFQEDYLLYVSDKASVPVTMAVDTAAEASEALVLGLRDYVEKNEFKKVVIGISGGIDSAVTAALAVEALEEENVVGLIMPSRFTSSETFEDAVTLCGNLGIEYKIIPIEGVFTAYLKSLEEHFKGKKPDSTEENIQARIRGSILMAFSNKFGYLVLNTGNKSELSVGYCTLYGDMVGGFGLLKDVTKELVYVLAERINKKNRRELIPGTVMRRVPSAELRFNQKDEDSIPPYEQLDPIIKLYIEKNFSFEQIVKEGFDPATVKRVISLVDKNEYKRRQGPPGVKITPKAFGKDRRMPITNRFLNTD